MLAGFAACLDDHRSFYPFAAQRRSTQRHLRMDRGRDEPKSQAGDKRLEKGIQRRDV